MEVKAGRYDFVELKYYKPPHGFGEDATFTDGRALFDALWQEWFNTTLYLTVKEMQLNDILYEEVFNRLPKEKQSAIIGRKADFAQKAEISTQNICMLSYCFVFIIGSVYTVLLIAKIEHIYHYIVFQ